MSLSFLVSTKKNNKQTLIDFKDIFKIKSELKTMTLLWDTNSYHINLADKCFIVNGGRRTNVTGFDGAVEIVYAKRHNMAVSFNVKDENGKGSIQKEETSYLLGMGGKDFLGVSKEIILHVSPNGKQFRWLDKR